MDRDPHDAQFTMRFRELQADDARLTPPAQRFLDAALDRQQGRPTRPWALLATAAAITVAVLLVIVFRTAPFAPRGTATVQLWQWQPPTAELLHPLNEDLLSQTPQLGTPLISNDGTKD